jgi:DNA-binding IclR family transcriptional regulator
MRADSGEPQAELQRVASYNVLVPGETVMLEPFARFSEPGHLFNYSKSAIRSLEVMELFRHTGAKLKAREIARALKIGPSSTDQLLKTLVDGAYLLFDPLTKYYWPSPRVAALAGGLHATLDVESRFEQFAATTRDELRKNASLSISQGTSMQIVSYARRHDQHAFDDERYERWSTQFVDGTRVPLFGSSSGAVWLSIQPKDVILYCIAQCRRELGALADDPERLLASLERIREQGFAFGGISPKNDFWGLSMTLPPTRQGDVHVIAVSAPHAELERDKEEIVDYLRARIARLREQASRAEPDSTR